MSTPTAADHVLVDNCQDPVIAHPYDRHLQEIVSRGIARNRKRIFDIKLDGQSFYELLVLLDEFAIKSECIITVRQCVRKCSSDRGATARSGILRARGLTMRHSLTTDTHSRLRRYQAALPDRLPDSAAWLPPCGMALLRAYLGMAEQNRRLYRWLHRGWWVVVVETGLLAGIALAYALNHLRF